MITITRIHSISTAHRLYEYGGQCERLHGHNYKICITLTAEEKNHLGMVMDFADVKKSLCTALDQAWDHKVLLFKEDPLCKRLSEILDDGSLQPVDFNPTAENMATYLGSVFFPQILAAMQSANNVSVASVTVYETDNNCATWSR